MATDLQQYELQLAQVEAALEAEPNKNELLMLKNDLLQVIALTRQLLNGDVSAPAAAPSTSASDAKDRDGTPAPVEKVEWQVGMSVEAKWSGDGRYYTARIDAVEPSGRCVVNFLGYNSVESVLPSDVRLPPGASKPEAAATASKESGTGDAAAGAAPATTGTGKRPAPDDGEEALAAKKKKINKEKRKQFLETKKTIAKAEEAIHDEKKNSWMQFNMSGPKKKAAAVPNPPPLLKKSMFATPDNPEGKVGVVGSGKGMTPFAQRQKYFGLKEGTT